MASKRRLRRNACGNKRRFTSSAEAFRMGKLVQRRQGQQFGRICSYRCSYCGAWHWGHST